MHPKLQFFLRCRMSSCSSGKNLVARFWLTTPPSWAYPLIFDFDAPMIRQIPGSYKPITRSGRKELSSPSSMAPEVKDFNWSLEIFQYKILSWCSWIIVGNLPTSLIVWVSMTTRKNSSMEVTYSGFVSNSSLLPASYASHNYFIRCPSDPRQRRISGPSSLFRQASSAGSKASILW